MGPRLLLAPHGERARAALRDAVDGAKAGDPLAPVTVAVPSTYAGLALRRALGREHGLVNVRFAALPRVAELLGAPDLAAAGLRPLAGPLRDEAVHATLASEPGFLSAVADHPSTEQTLAATFRDLRDAPAGSLAALVSGRGRAATIAGLYGRFRERTREFYDEADLAVAAAAAVATAPERLADVGHVVVYLPAKLSQAEEQLLGALAGADRVTVVLGLTHDAGVDAAIAYRLAARLEPVLGAAHPTDPPTDLFSFGNAPPRGTAVISTPDPEDEVRAVARRIAGHAERGLALHRIAVVARVEEPYGRLVPEVLDGCGIPWNGATPRRLADSTVGRVLRGLLELAEHDFARDAVAAWLASGPILDPVGGPGATRWVDSARADVLSREAGVVGGADQWADRLERHARTLEEALGDPTAAEAPEWRRRGLQRDVEAVRRLRAFVADLAEHVEPPGPPSWRVLSAWATGLLDRYLGPEARWGDWPDTELESGREARAAVERLAALDEFETTVDLARFRRAVVTALDVPTARSGRFGTGVFVGTLRQAYAAEFDVVYVLGTVEGAFPPRGREDPLLPDRDRARVDGLARHRTRRDEERHEYLAALASAPERVLCFARADARAQRRLLPSRWLLETAGALRGGEVTAEGLRDADDPEPWLDVVASFEAGIGGDAEPASRNEYDLCSLLTWRESNATVAGHPLAGSELRTGFDSVFARASGGFTAYDGYIRAGIVPDPDGRVVSPTSLESWATCPFRYLLGSVLRLRDRPRPEEIESITALDEGSLVHAILEQFVRTARPRRSPDEPWDDADRARMREITDRLCSDAERRGVTGRAVAWRLARRRIDQTVERFLETDPRVRAGFGVVPDVEGLELAFGLDGAAPVSVTLGDGRQVRFRGRIDRVDRSPDGQRVVVYDYKTGSNRAFAGLADGDPVAAGTKLQLPVYALAAEQHHGVTDAHAYYWFTAIDGDPLVGYAADHCRERFLETLTTIEDGVALGCFPAVPGERSWNPRQNRETFDHCGYCEFDRLCTVDREAAWQRKRTSPEVEPFVRLTADDEADEDGTDAEASR
jgi:RecB family exonuclease